MRRPRGVETSVYDVHPHYAHYMYLRNLHRSERQNERAVLLVVIVFRIHVVLIIVVCSKIYLHLII